MTPRNALASDKAVKPARAKRYVQSHFGASPPRYVIKHKRSLILLTWAKSGLRSTHAKRYAHCHFSDSGLPKGTRSPSRKHQDEGSAQRPQHTNTSETLKLHWKSALTSATLDSGHRSTTYQFWKNCSDCQKVPQALILMLFLTRPQCLGTKLSKSNGFCALFDSNIGDCA